MYAENGWIYARNGRIKSSRERAAEKIARPAYIDASKKTLALAVGAAYPPVLTFLVRVAVPPVVALPLGVVGVFGLTGVLVDGAVAILLGDATNAEADAIRGTALGGVEGGVETDVDLEVDASTDLSEDVDLFSCGNCVCSGSCRRSIDDARDTSRVVAAAFAKNEVDDAEASVEVDGVRDIDKFAVDSGVPGGKGKSAALNVGVGVDCCVVGGAFPETKRGAEEEADVVRVRVRGRAGVLPALVVFVLPLILPPALRVLVVFPLALTRELLGRRLERGGGSGAALTLLAIPANWDRRNQIESRLKLV
ncbi:hypothetical protein C8R43DRAFT_956217 [Mycena crocata]|nr:hypothetical protein C8R43DRAFT_956217 [Mycena crocata]